MSQVIDTPDGPIEFPDGMGQAAIEQALAQHHAAQQPSSAITNPIARWPLGLAAAAGYGAESVLGLPGDLASGVRTGANWLRDYGGLDFTPVTDAADLWGLAPAPTSSQIHSAIQSIGPQIGPPASGLERYARGGLEGVGAGLPLTFEGPIAPVLVQGFAGGLGTQAGSDLAPDSTLMPMLGGLVGGFSAGGIWHDVEGILARSSARKALAAADERLQAARDAIQQAKNPLSGTSQADARQQAADAFAQAKAHAETGKTQALTQYGTDIDKIAGTLGKSKTLDQAGEELQEAARSWLTSEMPKRQTAAWAPVNRAIDPGTEVDLAKFEDALGDITHQAGVLEPVAGLFKSDIPGNILSRLRMLQKPIEIPGEAPQPPPKIVWGDVQKLRSTIGDALGEPQIVNKIGRQNLLHLYASITNDMRTTAQGIGPQALGLFETANAESQRLFDFAEGPLARVVSGKTPNLASDPEPGKVAQSFLSGGRVSARDLQALRSEIPHAVDELGAATLRTSEASWDRLSPEARSALVPNPDAVQAITTARQTRDAAKLAAGLAISKAQGLMKGQLSSASDEYSLANFTRQNERYEAQKARDAAQAQVDATSGNLKWSEAQGVRAIIGAEIGKPLAITAMHALGLRGSDLYENAAPVLGALAPYAYHGIRSALLNPSRLRGPLAAAITANNPLQPPNQPFVLSQP